MLNEQTTPAAVLPHVPPRPAPAVVAAPCRRCDQWDNAPDDIYCGFCGALLLALEIEPAALTLISALVPSKEVAFRNSGARPMQIAVVQATGTPFPGMVIEPSGPFEIAAQGEVRVRFSLDPALLPAAFGEQRLDFVCLIDNDKRKQRRLQVVVRSGPRPKVLPAAIDFGSVAEGDAVTRTFEVVNSGGTPLRIASIETVGSADLRLEQPFAATVLVPAAKLTVSLVWESRSTPVAVEGPPGVRIRFGNHPDDAFIPAQARTFRYLLTATPAAVRFPRALSKRDHAMTVRLENQGSTDVEVVGIESDQPWLSVSSRSAAFTLLPGEPGGQQTAALSPTTFAKSYDFKVICRPGELPAGMHRGTVTIRAHGQRPVTLPVELDVVRPQPYPDYVGIDFGTSNSVVAVLNRKHEVELVEDELSRSHLIPSVLVLDDADSWKIGQAAKNEAPTAPDRTVRSIKRIMGYQHERRFFGRSYSAGALASRIVRKLVELAEQKLFKDSGTYYSVGKAIITVPANFFDLQIREVLEACREAGLDTEETRARITEQRLRETLGKAVNAGVILDEPSAAAFYYVHHLMKHGNKSAIVEAIGSARGLKLLVFDYGGGTLDVSIASVAKDSGETGLRILANVGDNGVGGDSIDLVLMKELLKRAAEMIADFGFDTTLISANYRELDARRDREGWSVSVWREVLRVRDGWKDLAEGAKVRLGTQEQVSVDVKPDMIVRLAEDRVRSSSRGVKVQVKRTILHTLLQPMLKKCTQLIDSSLELAGVARGEIDYILHTGRQSLLPLIRDHVQGLFPHLTADRSILDEKHLKVCVAKGAALYGSIRNRLVAEGARIHFFDEGRSLPHSYGVEAFRNPIEPEFDVIIPRGSKYPTAQTRHYGPEMIPDGGCLNLRFYQNTGTSTAIVDNPQVSLIGELSIDTAADGKPGCDVHFAIGANRTLEVFADGTPVQIQRASLQDEEGWMG
jgi:molecular chaperone DnaK